LLHGLRHTGMKKIEIKMLTRHFTRCLAVLSMVHSNI
jgi:hypothetical protein